MAPREAEFADLIQKLIQQQDDLLSEKRKSKVQLILSIAIPASTVLLAAMAFYFNTQADIRRLDKDLSEIKTAVASIATLDRARMQSEIDKLQREAEKRKL
jgi:type II secretory pathway component PulJ